MKVLKFGGTSVGSVESIQRVKKIVDAMAEPAIVVVSAVGGITDKLIATTTKAVTSDTTYTTDFEKICKIHTNIIDGVVPADKLASVKEQVNNLLEEVGTILKGVEGIEDNYLILSAIGLSKSAIDENYKGKVNKAIVSASKGALVGYRWKE